MALQCVCCLLVYCCNELVDEVSGEGQNFRFSEISEFGILVKGLWTSSMSYTVQIPFDVLSPFNAVHNLVSCTFDIKLLSFYRIIYIELVEQLKYAALVANMSPDSSVSIVSRYLLDNR